MLANDAAVPPQTNGSSVLASVEEDFLGSLMIGTAVLLTCRLIPSLS